MTAIAFYPAPDHPGDGSAYFKKEALRWAELHNGVAHEFAAHKMNGIVPRKEMLSETAKRRAQIIAVIDAAPAPITDVAFFCHGWRTGFQAGFDVASSRELVAALARKSTASLRVWLYCCACGTGPLDSKYISSDKETGDGSVADAIRDGLCLAGLSACRVDAHATVGDATHNADVRRFEAPAGVGGYNIVARGSPLRPFWVDAINHTDFRLRLTEIDADKIRAGLDAVRISHSRTQ